VQSLVEKAARTAAADLIHTGFYEYQSARRAHWDSVAQGQYGDWSRYYHAYLSSVYRQIVPPGASVLELGCGTGDLLASLQPSIGVGLDLSAAMIKAARERHAEMEFIVGDVHEIEFGARQFDFIIFSDLINDLWDVECVLQRLRHHCHPGTRLVFNFFSQLWALPVSAARRLGAATPTLLQNWFTCHDLDNLLELTGYQPLRQWGEIVCPIAVPALARVANGLLAKFFPFRLLAMTNLLVARPMPTVAAREQDGRRPTVSVIVPARDEAGNIEQAIARIPEMGGGTEIIFVEGNSSDDTYATIERCIAAHPGRRAILLKQRGKGKGDAVRAGFEAASGDILIILDADLTVAPEDLPRFFHALTSGRGEFVNGVRLVYPMDEDAMRAANLVGNKFFSWAFSWLLGQKIRDTLCGTKVLWAKDYRRIAANRAYFGDFDPFGDFDLLFGAARLNLRIIEVPVRYRSRQYGTTSIQRWRHGLLLLRMVVFAARRIKFR
jgi:SAM-dependent methyltransferase